jgi:hypothetical protein
MSDFTKNMAPINRAVLEVLKKMGRIDGDMSGNLMDGVEAPTGGVPSESIPCYCPKCHASIRIVRPAVGAGANESSTIEGWRRECERLQGRVAELEDEQDKLAAEHNDRVFERDKLSDLVSQQTAFIARLEVQLKAGRQCVAERDDEIERLKAENDRLRMAARDETPRSLSEHSRESRPITCRLRIHGFISSHPVDTTIEF